MISIHKSIINSPFLAKQSLMTACSRQPKRHLKTVINQPLKRRQCPNHQNPNRQPIPQPRKPNIAINPSHRLACSLSRLSVRIEFGNHDVCRVRDDCAGDTGDVTAEEGDAGLLEPVVGGFGLPEHLVDFVYCGLEGGEFAHCVGDLTAPERVEAFVQATMISSVQARSSPKIGIRIRGENEPSISLCCNHLRHSLSQCIRKRW
jgi:hypothetical protein